MELPANICTPTYFCDRAAKEFEGLPNVVSVEAHDLAWAEEKKMGSFISVSRGSDEPLRFLEIHYNGGKKGEKPLALVGKGITFDVSDRRVVLSPLHLCRTDSTDASRSLEESRSSLEPP